MAPLRSVKSLVVLAVLAMGALLTWHVRQDIPPGGPRAKPAFDFYLLAMTMHAAFCDDGHADKKECRAGSKRPLVIHGLWPERLEPRTYPRDCPAPRLDLQPSQLEVLREYMPGVHSGLHLHEWREHGSCSGLDADVYFEETLLLARELDAALSGRLTTLGGEEATAAQIRAAAEAYRPGLGKTFTLHCRNLRNAPPGLRDRPFLVEIRQCVDNDGQLGDPETPLVCARVDRHDQGCGTSFRIARRAQ
jgi:ribonuclease I